jgi:hypothetical protein
MRRTLSRERGDTASEGGVEDLVQFARTFVDLDDADIMNHAWT